jgi:hypothetical protein
MTADTRRRTDPIAAHAYTLPVVREILVSAAAPPASGSPQGAEQPIAYAADAHAW